MLHRELVMVYVYNEVGLNILNIFVLIGDGQLKQ